MTFPRILGDTELRALPGVLRCERVIGFLDGAPFIRVLAVSPKGEHKYFADTPSKIDAVYRRVKHFTETGEILNA